MASSASMDYLQRKRIFMPQTRHRARWAGAAQKTHTRPVIPLEALVPPDSPSTRVITVAESKRLPYKD